MIFFFKSDGTLIKSAPETVYQGSAEAGKVYVVAPLNANMLVDVYYELPNGERWGAYLLENNGTVIKNEELPDGWALWSTTLESAITQYAGTLKAQFGFYQSGTADKVPLITSQGVTITIAKGVVRDLPSAPTADVYAQIVNAISSIKQDIANLPNEYLSNTNEDKIALKNNKEIEYSENATAGTIVKRDSDGKINVADGTEDLNAVNVRKLNAELETKVTRAPIESGYYNLYGESHDGQIAVPFSQDTGLGTIPQRTPTGQLKAADGVADDDLATVKQLNAVKGNYTDITNIDLNTGDTTVEYDTELGITVNSKGTLTHKNGAAEQPTTKFEVPIIAGAGVSIDKKETEEKVEIKSLNSNLENGTGDVLIQTNDTNPSFKVMKDGRAKVKTAPKESTDVVRLEDIKNMSATIVDLGRSNSMTGDDYTKLENNENALLIYDGVVYRRSRGTNYGYDEMQFESIDDSVQTATIYITNCVVTVADEAAGVISVTDTAGLKVGMTIMFTTSGGSILYGISYRKIASIDTENKKITMDGIVIDSDTLTDGSFIAVKANATSTNLTNCVVTTADEAAGVISVTNGKSLTVGMYIDFRASNGSILSGISNRKIIAKDIANNKITVSGTVIDSDTLTSGCYITLANDIGFNKIYNRVLRIWKQKPDSTTAYVRYAYIPIGGLPVTPSKATASATSGTFTDSEWSKLQANDNNYILFNNEIYRLADKAHSGTTGIWSYTHTGWDGTAIMDKSINVTVSTGAWTLVVGEGGGLDTIKAGTGAFSEIFNYDANNANVATGENSHAEGSKTYASKDSAHAEGYNTGAQGNYAHAEGDSSIATGTAAHAEGTHTIATQRDSHAEGFYCESKGSASHAEGLYACADNDYSHAEGKCNIKPMPTGLIHATGIGTDSNNRRDGFEVYTTGEVWCKGPLYVGGVDDSGADIYKLDRTKAKEVATIEYVDSKAGGKLYLHSLYFASTQNKPLLTFYSTSPTKVTDEWIYNNLTGGKYCLTFYPTITSIYQYGGVGLSAVLSQTSSSPSWGALIDLDSTGSTTLSVSQATYTVTEV